MKFLFNNGNQHVRGDGAPDLRLHRILAVADETLDAQMLLDPFEVQFDLPAALVKNGDGQCGQGRIVDQEQQRLAGFRIFETDAPEFESQGPGHEGMVDEVRVLYQDLVSLTCFSRTARPTAKR